jgi:hypothetical protein
MDASLPTTQEQQQAAGRRVKRTGAWREAGGYLLARRGFLAGIAALIVAWLAQLKFTPDATFLAPRQPNLNFQQPPEQLQQGAWLYLAAICLMIVGFIATYRTKSFIRQGNAVQGDGAAFSTRGRVVVSPRRRWWRFALGAAAAGANAFAVWGQSVNPRDLTYILAWLLSIVLLICACARQHTGVWPPRMDNAADYGDADRDEDGTRNSRWALHDHKVELVLIILIVIVTAFCRLYNLDHIPIGMDPDEAENGSRGLAVWRGTSPSPLLGSSDWFHYPLMAMFLQVSGTFLLGSDTAAGERLFSAVSGTLSVLFFYLLLRELFKGRTALIGAALLATGEFAIQFARFPLGNESLNLCWLAGFYFLFRGLRGKRYLDFVLGGIVTAFGLYFYPSSRLIVLFLAVLALYLAVTRRRFLADYWGHVLVTVCGFIAVASPIGYFTYTDNEAINERLREVTVLSPTVAAGVFARLGIPYKYPLPVDPHGGVYTLAMVRSVLQHWGDGWGQVLLHQAVATYTALNYEQDGSTALLFPYGFPMFGPFLSVLTILGIAYFLWRWRDPRCFVFSMIFWLGLFNSVALTVDTPNYLRMSGMTPYFYVFPAVFLNKIVFEMERTGWFSPRPLLARFQRASAGGADGAVAGSPPQPRQGGFPLPGLLAAALVLLLSGQQAFTYFVTIQDGPVQPWTSARTIGEYIRTIQSRYYIYHVAAPNIFFRYVTIRYLTPNAQGEDLIDYAGALPLHSPPTQDVAFMIYPSYQPLVAAVKAYYPSGAEDDVDLLKSTSLAFTSIRVGKGIIRATQALTTTYYTGLSLTKPGPVQAVARSTTLALRPGAQPRGLRYPASVRWSGGLYAPVYGAYGFTLRSSNARGTGEPAHLYLDGRRWATLGTSRSMTSAALVLAQGWHNVALRAALPSAAQRVSLSWSYPGQAESSIPSYYLYDGYASGRPHGLLAEYRTAAGNHTLIVRRVEQFVGQIATEAVFNTTNPVTVRWRGRLLMPTGGRYTFDVQQQGRIALYLDSQDRAHKVTLGVPTELRRGAHRFYLAYDWPGGDPFTSGIALTWTPPGRQNELIPAADLVPDPQMSVPAEKGSP